MVSGFSRLKSIFSGSINLKTYKEIVSVSKSSECGTIPKDLCGIFDGGKSTVSTTKAEIEAVKDALSEASDKLAHGICVSQRAQAIKLQRELGSSFDKSKIISLNFLKEINSYQHLLNPASSTRGIDSASKVLTESFSKIIPGCAKVEIKPLNMGSFGQGYKLEFLDANGNKIIHDKVLKVFYNEGQSQMDLCIKMAPLLLDKSKEFISQFTLRDIITLFNNIKNITVEEVTTFIKPFQEILAKQGITVKPEDIEKGVSKLKSITLKDIKPIFSIMKSLPPMEKGVDAGMGLLNPIQARMSKMHGVYAEANTMMFLRNRVGHPLSRTNVVAPDYYNLKKRFSIAEYSDDSLLAPTTEVNFELLGLTHTDLHKANQVSGRIIDIGGIELTVPELADKITARYYKKIMNQKNPELRKKYILQLEKEIETMNDLDKEKIKRAINLAA